MSQTKRTYALAAESLRKFERLVPPGKRSKVIGGLLDEWLRARERQALRADLTEACAEMTAIHLEIEREFRPLEEEVQVAFDDAPKTRRRRKGSA